MHGLVKNGRGRPGYRFGLAAIRRSAPQRRTLFSNPAVSIFPQQDAAAVPSAVSDNIDRSNVRVAMDKEPTTPEVTLLNGEDSRGIEFVEKNIY